jgi:glycosyltransferase involved in cell wall biosynthesis
MRILVLSFYFRPDLSAGSFRTAAFVSALRAQADPAVQIDVVTTLPNRYATFSQDAPEHEVAEGLEVHRVVLPRHSSDIVGQAKAFCRFARGALQLTRGREYQLVFATSSRLMTATLGSLIARRKRVPLYLDIRDIFVDTIEEMFPRWFSWPAQRFFSALEKWSIGRAARINLVSRGFEGYFRSRYAGIPLAWYTNGIDSEFIKSDLRRAGVRNPIATVLYAGNIGEGQALHRVVPGLAKLLDGRARIVIVGDGGRRRELEAAVAGIGNVELRAPMSRADLLAAYNEADVLFMHLGDYAAFEKVLPSKIFEYAALGKPILAGVAGYAATFVQGEISNAAVFMPCDAADGESAFRRLVLETTPRPEFVEKYARSNIARAMADDVLSLLVPS